ncbi:kinesin-like protein KIF13B [Thalassophryne amazonica]|uniref:kinesin-like protein KIF13B n=1 Tax=Thalassophryne amazonica TaxID=390379 RepID=UPI001470A2E4|nr:kinesin-like protein KIF13B [Thalassophryne amazonica]
MFDFFFQPTRLSGYKRGYEQNEQPAFFGLIVGLAWKLAVRVSFGSQPTDWNMLESSLDDSNVKVAVRVRPMNRREKELNTKCVVEMVKNQTILHPAGANLGKGDSRNHSKVFAYDYCFWSMDETEKEKFAGQEVVFQCLGESLLHNAFLGYNACIFAYGQTGSGKSYTMMGSGDQPGLIPRLCSALFERTQKEQREEESFTVEVSYMEIYNEKVRDLLDPKGGRQTLRVREHKVLGPYVDGLSRLAVASYKDIESLMSEGNKSRTVAATNMNEESSRSHAVFNIILTHTLKDLQSGTSGEKVSRLSLVDLAGSERAAKTGAAGERLKEGSNINKSLTTLGLVISALAEQGTSKNKTKFVPYRDSVLTWLLKDCLGGNSRTAMVATVSPAADNYEETLSTLRYADRAKNIVNHAIVNEDPNARIIRELREEVEKLRVQLTQAESLKAPELKERLEESEKLIQEMTITWEEKLRKTEEIAQERQKQLESLGISLQSSGIKVGDDKSFLVNLNADPALNELLVYYLKEHTKVGFADSQDIQLCGMGIQAEHCIIDIMADAAVILTPYCNARTCVNGSPVTSALQLHHGDRILWGNNHFFRINLPKRKSRAAEDEEAEAGGISNSSEQLDADGDTSSEVSSEVSFSYEFAQTEVMMKALGNNDPMQAVLQSLERQHEEEKRSALERQRQMYEEELQQLRRKLNPDRLSGQSSVPASGQQGPGLQSHYRSMERLSVGATSHSSSAQSRLKQWNEDRLEACWTFALTQYVQGQSRRIQVDVRSVQDSGTMPLIVEMVLSVSVGCVEIRCTTANQEGDEMDSYQERDLDRLRHQWLAALTKRQEYLDQHLQSLVNKAEKTEDDVEREAQLLEWRLTLTEERNAVMVPSAGSGIPGAPAEWVPLPGMETHIPVLFLNLRVDDLSFPDQFELPEAGGWDATLSGEDEDDFFDLQIVRHCDGEVKAEASWDSTVHECPQLSRGGMWPEQRVYLTVRVVVQLSHPADMQLVLRKRICVSVNPGRQGFAHNLLKRISSRSTIPGSGVTFEVVSNIPGDAPGSEDREMLARLAASAHNSQSADNEAAIEKYLRSVLSLENILTLDRLRQEVAVKEQLAAKGRSNRRSLSSPSVHRLFGSRQDLSSTCLLDEKGRWESQQDVFMSSQFSRSLPRPASSPPIYSTSSSQSPFAVTPPQNQEPEQGHSGLLAASYLSVKALVPQMPKLLKSLFPVRDDKKELRPTSQNQQHHVPRVVMSSGGDDTRVKAEGVAVPCPSTKDKLSEFPEHPSLPVHDLHDATPLSPLSQSSSGYFSSSVSAVTLSDVLHPSSSSSSLLAAETTSVTNLQQQEADQNDVVTSPPQCGTKMAVVTPPTSHSSANHNSVCAENRLSEQRLDNSGGQESFERLEAFVDDEERCHENVLPDWLTDGAYVTVGSSKAGTVRYVGTTQFAKGVWVGVELDTPVGKNDGSVRGHRYFHCKPSYGVLVRPDRLSFRHRNGQSTGPVDSSAHATVL